jgi:peroxiredoxin
VVVILAQRAERVRQFVEEHRLTLPILIDERRETAKAYGVWHRLGLDALNIARPALFVIGRSGTIRSIYVAESQGEFPTHEQILSDLDGLNSCQSPNPNSQRA